MLTMGKTKLIKKTGRETKNRSLRKARRELIIKALSDFAGKGLNRTTEVQLRYEPALKICAQVAHSVITPVSRGLL